MKKKWFRMDNAALIFPAIMRRNWNNVFRLSITLTENIDTDCLNAAVKDIMPRFPTFFVRLRTGFFWYYLEQVDKPVEVRPDFAYPLTHMSRKELHRCCVRILYYENRIAAEFFHSVTDGTGGSIFLQNLTARYLELKYGIDIPAENDILDINEAPKKGEISDGFLRHSGKYPMNDRETMPYRLRGEPDEGGFRTLTTGIVPTEALLRAAHEKKVTVTAFLSAVMAEAIQSIQEEKRPRKRYRPVKITIPINLRRLYGAKTLRNFILALNIGFDPKQGDYNLDQICGQISHQLASEAVPQKMACRIAANVNPQKNPVIRAMPLFIKNPVMRMVYAVRGESGGCISLSNLGQIKLPGVMEPYVKRFEFIIGVQFSYPNNCSVASIEGKTYINMIRSTRDSELERRFFSRLVELGVPVDIECNKRR